MSAALLSARKPWARACGRIWGRAHFLPAVNTAAAKTQVKLSVSGQRHLILFYFLRVSFLKEKEMLREFFDCVIHVSHNHMVDPWTSGKYCNSGWHWKVKFRLMCASYFPHLTFFFFVGVVVGEQAPIFHLLQEHNRYSDVRVLGQNKCQMLPT